MTETIAAMMDMIPSATPQQLADLSALLESDTPRSPAAAADADTAGRLAVKPAAAKPAVTTALRTDTRVDANLQSDTLTDARPVIAQPAIKPAPAPLATAPLASVPLATVPSVIAPSAPPVPVSAPAPMVAPAAPVASAHSSADPSATRVNPRAAELFARGLQAERDGDVSGARRFYATAAGLGSATAARSLGRLYDPAYLKQAALGGIDPDPALARHWYEQAVSMGDLQATPLLQALAAR